MNTPVKPTPTPSPSKMTLGAVVKGRLKQPTRTVIFGPEGCGKSSFAAAAPSPIFIGAEDGTAQLDVARLPQPESFADALEAVRLLAREKHEYKTLVVDTLDWLEPLVWTHICVRDSKENIEAYGYGKGYQAALDEWRIFLAALESTKAKGMHIILVAHSWLRPFKNPTGEDYDRYEMKLNAKAAGLIKEWADSVLFADYETFARVDSKTKRVRGVSTGERIIYTQRRAAFDAKNRYSLPEELPLDWGAYFAAVQAGQVDAASLRADIEKKAATFDATIRAMVIETMTKAGDDINRLVLVHNRVNQKMAEMAANKES